MSGGRGGFLIESFVTFMLLWGVVQPWVVGNQWFVFSCWLGCVFCGAFGAYCGVRLVVLPFVAQGNQ